MIIIDPKIVHHTKSCIVTGELRVRGDVGEDGMDELIWEFENCEAEWINIRSKKLVREFVPRLV